MALRIDALELPAHHQGPAHRAEPLEACQENRGRRRSGWNDACTVQPDRFQRRCHGADKVRHGCRVDVGAALVSPLGNWRRRSAQERRRRGQCHPDGCQLSTHLPKPQPAPARPRSFRRPDHQLPLEPQSRNELVHEPLWRINRSAHGCPSRWCRRVGPSSRAATVPAWGLSTSALPVAKRHRL